MVASPIDATATHLKGRTCSRELTFLRPDEHLNNVIAIRSNRFLLHSRCTRQINSLSDISISLGRIAYGVPLIIYEHVLFAVCSNPFASAQFYSFSTFCKQLQ